MSDREVDNWEGSEKIVTQVRNRAVQQSYLLMQEGSTQISTFDIIYFFVIEKILLSGKEIATKFISVMSDKDFLHRETYLFYIRFFKVFWN